MSPTVAETFSICWYKKRRVDCEKIFRKILTDFGFCFAFNMLDHSEIFSDSIGEDFDSFKHGKSTQWSLHGGYNSHENDVFPIRASKNSPLTFVLNVNRSDVENLCLRAGRGHRFFFTLPNEIPTLFHDEHFITFNTERVITIAAKSFSADENSLKYSPIKRLSYAKNERNLKFFKSYTKSHCDIENLSHFIYKSCACQRFSMPRFNDTPVCNLTHAICYLDAISNWPYADPLSRGKTAMPYDCFSSSNYIHYSVKLDRSYGYEAKERNATKE